MQECNFLSFSRGSLHPPFRQNVLYRLHYLNCFCLVTADRVFAGGTSQGCSPPVDTLPPSTADCLHKQRGIDTPLDGCIFTGVFLWSWRHFGFVSPAEMSRRRPLCCREWNRNWIGSDVDKLPFVIVVFVLMVLWWSWSGMWTSTIHTPAFASRHR